MRGREVRGERERQARAPRPPARRTCSSRGSRSAPAGRRRAPPAPADRAARRPGTPSAPARRRGTRRDRPAACAAARAAAAGSVPGARPRPEIDAAGKQRLERAELLGDLQRRVVGQHDPAGADADARGAAADVRRSAPRWPRWRCPACCGARPASSGCSPSLRRAARDRASCGRRRRPCRLRRWERDRAPRAAWSRGPDVVVEEHDAAAGVEAMRPEGQ